MNYKISTKRKDTGKWHTYGNVKQGEKGFKMGIRKTPELVKLFEETKEGEWINFVLFEEKESPKYSPAVTQGGRVVDDEIPF